jgi:hypothetical protein
VVAHIARICTELGLSVPSPLGEVAPRAADGTSAADSPRPVPSGPPRSLPDGSPEGEAAAWRSSA